MVHAPHFEPCHALFVLYWQSNLTVTVEVADVNDSPFWESEDLEISVMEVSEWLYYIMQT